MTAPATETAGEKAVDVMNDTTGITAPADPLGEAEEKSTSADESPLEKTTSKIENYPQGLKLALILTSIYLSVFLVALDRTILATALPTITNKFHSFGDIGWVRSTPNSQMSHAGQRMLTRAKSTTPASFSPRPLYNCSSGDCTRSTRPNGSLSPKSVSSKSARRYVAQPRTRSRSSGGGQLRGLAPVDCSTVP